MLSSCTQRCSNYSDWEQHRYPNITIVLSPNIAVFIFDQLADNTFSKDLKITCHTGFARTGGLLQQLPIYANTESQTFKLNYVTHKSAFLLSPNSSFLRPLDVKKSTQYSLPTSINGFQDHPSSWRSVIVLLTCLQAHVATRAVRCKAMALRMDIYVWVRLLIKCGFFIY